MVLHIAFLDIAFSRKKRVLPGLLNLPKHKFKLKWNVPLSDVEFIEYGAGVSVAAGKYGTTTTYSEQGAVICMP